jgi:hypothetical protein
MATPVNVGVSDDRNILTFDRSSSELKGLKEKHFSFTITEVANGQSQAEFQVTDSNGQILRRNVSKPFTAGAIQKKSTKLTKDSYVVEIKKHANILLDDHF